MTDCIDPPPPLTAARAYDRAAKEFHVNPVLNFLPVGFLALPSFRPCLPEWWKGSTDLIDAAPTDRLTVLSTPQQQLTQDGTLNPDRKKVVWSQKVSPQNRDKRAVEERKRKMIDMRKCVSETDLLVGRVNSCMACV